MLRQAYSEIIEEEVTPERVEANPQLKEGLLCCFCKIKVGHRKAHIRRGSSIASTFVKREDHKKCPYNAKQQMEIIAKDSDDNVVKSIGSNKYELRLNMLYEAVSKPNSRIHDNSNLRIHPVEKNYIKQGNLDSYLSTINKIIQLRNLLEEEEDYKDLTSLVKIKHQGKEISWNNFYYEPDRYKDAFEFISRGEVPICLVGTISKIVPLDDRFAINLVAGKSYKEDNKNYIPMVSIYLDEKLKDKLNLGKGDHIAVSAIFTSKQNKNFLNIRGKLKNSNQICELKEKQ